MNEPTRLYIRTSEQDFRPFAWVLNNKLNEMLFGLYGLSTKQPTLCRIWPERELTSDDLGSVKYIWDDGEKVNYVVDHVTCHADGTFHIKTKNSEDLYIQRMKRTKPLGVNTGIFLEFTLITDSISAYRSVGSKIKHPYAWFEAPVDHYVSLRGIFSGSNFNAESVMAATMSRFPGLHGRITLTSHTLKGIVVGKPKMMPKHAKKARPKGTLLSFKFPVAGGHWHLKSFLFA